MQQSVWIGALANLSAAFLLTGVLGLLVTGSALLWLSGRGLVLARRELARWAPQALAWVISLQTYVQTEAEEQVFQPHVRLLSSWRGLRAGVAAFVQGPRDTTT